MATQSATVHHGEPDPASSSPFSVLPVALLARVLQHMPQQQRLTRCALVSRDWAAAAAAGTLRIEHQSLNSSKCESVGTWIEKHGKQLVSMQLAWWQPVRPKLQLPCAQLQQLTGLSLSGLHLQQSALDHSPSSSSSAPSQHLPRLKGLSLWDCALDSASALLLGRCTGVTHLSIHAAEVDVPQDSELPATLAREAQRSATSTAVLGLLQHMTQLQCLNIGQSVDTEAWAAATFPPSITSMSITARRGPIPCSLQHLSGLQDLMLLLAAFRPAVLELDSLSQLQALELHCCTLLPDADGVDGATVLLAAIRCMQQLRRLVLSDSSLATAQPGSFSALTASSHLTHLEIVLPRPAATNGDQALPRGALQHMFPAGRLQPQLQRLSLSCIFPDAKLETPVMTSADLAALIRACPGLTSLDITKTLQPGDSCTALLQLPPTCRQLSIGGEAFSDSAVATVVQLTQLTYLAWVGSGWLTDVGLYQLTALQGLKELRLQNDTGLSNGLLSKVTELGCESDVLHLMAGDQPVWQQLQDRMRACASNAAWVAQLDQQQQEIQRLQLTNT